MEVIVKNNQISKTHISKMAYNNIQNVLACNIDGNDTILFYSLQTQSMTFVQLFKGMSKPPGSKISMCWSPDGRYLALGAGNIQLWELKQGKLKPVKSYQQDFIEIKIIQWSIDSLSYACGGISRTNTIRIRNIETNKTKQLQLPDGQTISAISFDPYGKYLLLLLRNNTIEIYSVLNYERYKTLRLSPQGLKINPIKEVRIPSWSPDFSNFVCPSLDDSRINIAINLSRSKDFKTKNIFMGHCTSISCCKFNPKLYRWKGQVTAIVAMGDSAGNVSLWRVGNKNQYPEPLLLSNSLQNSLQVVEDIQWDDKGQILMVNMMKKYVHLIKFINRAQHFGQQLTNEETFSLIKQIYGSNRATDVNKREIQVFDLNFSNWNGNSIQEEKKLDEPVIIKDPINIEQQNHKLVESNKQPALIQILKNISKSNTQMQVEETQKVNNNFLQNKVSTQPLPMQVIPQILPQRIPVQAGSSNNEYVKVCEQKVIIGKNNKKKIQPAMMMRKDEINTANIKQPFSVPYNFGQPSNTTLFSNSMVQTFQSLQLPHISFTDKQLTLNKNRILQIKRLNKVTSLQIIDLIEDSNEPIAKRIFPMMVDYIHVTDKFIYVINQQFLYVFDFDLNPKELPFKVGHVHMFLANDFGDVYIINCDGYLIGFNHLQNVNKTIAPAPLHFLLRQDFKNQSNQDVKLTIKQFLLTKNSDILITVQTEKANNKVKRQRFMYDVKKNGWVKLEFKQGILEPGFSIRITDTEENMIKSFFTSLCPSLRQKSMKEYQFQNQLKRANTVLQNVISPQQQEMIYYSKYKNDKEKFFNSIIEYIKSLKITNRNKQLRSCINKYFFDEKSGSYFHNKEEKDKLWSRVKNQIGGTIIQEFQFGFIHSHMIQQE